MHTLQLQLIHALHELALKMKAASAAALEAKQQASIPPDAGLALEAWFEEVVEEEVVMLVVFDNR